MQSLKILLVDDNVEYAGTLQHMLAGKVLLTHVTNGGKALDLLRAGQTFDAVLLDLSMPIVNGWETLDEMAKDRSLPLPPPVILLSDYVDRPVADVDMSLVAGSIPRMTPPDELLKQVHFYLRPRVQP